MKHPLLAFLLLASVCPTLAAADERVASPVTVSAAFGYAYPVGSTERGNDTRDVSFGLVPISLLAAYDIRPAWSAQIQLDYAANIPTLCSSSSDCLASVGHDVELLVGIARTLPRWHRVDPRIELALGWEWLATRLSDSGVVSTRSWNGPVARIDVFVNLKTSDRWTLGPVLALDVGVYSSFDLSTPAWERSGSTDAAIHAWPSIALRAGRRF